MNRTTTLLLSLLLVAGTSISSVQAQEQGNNAFSVDELTFNLDWNDTQFDWSQTSCLDLGVGEDASADPPLAPEVARQAARRGSLIHKLLERLPEAERVPMGSGGGAWATDPAVAFQTYFVPQGISADIIATEYGLVSTQSGGARKRARLRRDRVSGSSA